jgi:hypothetical protein
MGTITGDLWLTGPQIYFSGQNGQFGAVQLQSTGFRCADDIVVTQLQGSHFDILEVFADYAWLDLSAA